MPSSTTSSNRVSEPARVLLVDDNEAMLSRAAAVLARECVVVGQAFDGEAALEAAARLSPDVIVLDISMPGMTGFEVAARLSTLQPTAAIVFLTVYADEEVVRAAQAAGGVGYVIKTRMASDLLIAVREARARRPFVSALR
jgi:DNA-binding NarL/FixJ family response regulator